MLDVNQVTLLGNISTDIETFTTENEKNGARFSVATNDPFRKNAPAQFHRVIVWGKDADFVSKYLAKGRRVYVQGRLDSNKSEDGRTFWSVVADRIGPEDSRRQSDD